MQDEKLENQLKLALSLTKTERMEAPELSVGYEPASNQWQLIVYYTGDIEEVAKALSAPVVTLLGQYAILTVEEELIGQLTDFPQVLFVEKPKNLLASVSTGRRVSCVDELQSGRIPEAERLTGAGVLVGIPDSGIDYRHPDFRNADGTTRILALWDQTTGNGDNRYGMGQIFTESAINAALFEEQEISRLITFDASGHGTAVAGIAAGNGRASGGSNRGVAPEAGLVVVRLSSGTEQGFSRTTSLMMAVDFCIRVAKAVGKPIAINISYGSNYGSHTGNSIPENFMNRASESYRTSIIAGSGNEGITGRHAFINLTGASAGERGTPQDVEFVIGAGESNISLQLWKNYFDDFSVSLIAPSGEELFLIPGDQSVQTTLGGIRVIYYFAEPTPVTTQQELLMELLPVTAVPPGGKTEERRADRENPFTGTPAFLPQGVFRIRLKPGRILLGNVDLWLPAAEQTNRSTAFLRPAPETTLTIPSTSEKVITVSAYNGATGRFAAFSGQGFLRGGGIKPDLCAPGVDVLTTSPGGGYGRYTGTSFAAPFVTGGAALLMEWGIVRGNDPFLYGEKLKAYLIRGARQLPGFLAWPNPQAGYGALCVAESIPREKGIVK